MSDGECAAGEMGLRLGLMQPYLVPYVGYFQLIAAVDRFILYDDVKWIKGGWINRNRLLLNGEPKMTTLPVQKQSSYALINEFLVSVERDAKGAFLETIQRLYRESPRFDEVYPLFQRVFGSEERNLSRFIGESIRAILGYLDISRPISYSSELTLPEGLAGQDRVLAICRAAGATTYVNAIGGQELYSRDAFAEAGIELKFLKTVPIEYRQFGAPFVPFLSIVDLLMFNTKDQMKQHLASYVLL